MNPLQKYRDWLIQPTDDQKSHIEHSLTCDYYGWRHSGEPYPPDDLRKVDIRHLPKWWRERKLWMEWRKQHDLSFSDCINRKPNT